MRARTATSGTVAAVAAMVTLGGCATPRYTYVAGSGHDLVLRVPRSWTEVDTAAVLEASGADPDTFSGWAAFYDAADTPDPAHVSSDSTAAPVLLARSIEVAQEEREGLTTAQLRESILPSDATQREIATAAGTFDLITDETVDDGRGTGVHVVYSYQLSTGTTEFVDEIALTDPEHSAVNLVYAHCEETCFRSRAEEIGAAVTSLTLKNL